MCILASPVRDVSNTLIYAAANRSGTRQVVVYAMSVKLRDGEGNAMILPVPQGQIELVDLSRAPDFFEPLVEAFTERTRSFSLGPTKGVTRSLLKVEQVGSYNVSVVPTVDDISRVNTSVFTLSPETERVLRVNYPRGYSFVVAQLRKSGAFHPLAYTHPLKDEKLFIPTRHEHGHKEEVPRWDHQIFYPGSVAPVILPRYVRNAASIGYPVPAKTCMREVLVKATMLGEYLPQTGMITRLKAVGPLANIDVQVPV